MRIEKRRGAAHLMVRIAVVEGEESVHFQAEGPFTVEDDCHPEAIEGKPGEVWEVRLKGGEPARFSFFIRADLLTDVDQARRRLRKFESLKIPAHLSVVGQRLEHHGKLILDNREHWVCLGAYGSQEQAQEVLDQLDLGENALVLPEISGVPRGHVEVVGPDGEVRCLGRRLLVQSANLGHIILHDSPVGREFHWEHREKLSYREAVEFLVGNDGKLVAVNELPLEEYLVSVNSSEMDARCHLELLKAQTVAARATILATAGKHHRSEPFDLCNGDHCQCYYGSVREGSTSRQAVEETLGEVLMADGRICDARYAKVCGGIMEANEHVWPGQPISYLRSGVDAPSLEAAEGFYPISSEDQARRWIVSTPEAYCNPDVPDLPDYLSYARDYYRWKVCYERGELEGIIENRSGHKIGTLQDLRPLTRGESGRISRLEIVGQNGSLVLERELEIRRVLSHSHLYSSCFTVNFQRDANGQIQTVVLHGAGWGHGVGLCQVGAAMMAVRGKKYDQILAHYYRDTSLKRIF
jgi:stage II sporulation protein D